MQKRPLSQLSGWMKQRKAGIARKRFGDPARSLTIIAVSGSRGKTTVAHILYHIFAVSGIHVGMISTEGLFVNGKEPDRDFSVNVTDPEELNAALDLLRGEQVQIVVMETPTDMIREHVFEGIVFDSAVLTNIAGGEFILSYDSSQAIYAETTFTPILNTAEEGLVVINADDDSAAWIRQRADGVPQRLYAAWVSKSQVTDFSETIAGMSFSFEGGFFDSELITKINLENLLLAIRCAMKYLGVDQIDSAINSFGGVPGRLTTLQYEPFSVVIDYEYMPMVLQRVFYNLRELANENSSLISVIGAAGNRGNLRKQALKVASRYCGLVVLTALDPRNESVSSINNALLDAAGEEGLVVVERFTDHAEFEEADKDALLERVKQTMQTGDCAVVVFDSDSPTCRFDAIQFAFMAADPGDMVVIPGKGDDEVLDFGNTIYEWNDIRVVEGLLENGDNS